MISDKIGIIGLGNMGKALAEGFLQEGILQPGALLNLWTRNQDTLQGLAEKGAVSACSAQALVARSAYIILAVKPWQVKPVVEGIKSSLNNGHVLISVAAGVTVADLKSACDNACPVVRVMPNTFVAVGSGLFGLCFDDPSLPVAQKGCVANIFSRLGRIFDVPESKMSAFSALAGCGPAYVLYFAEALIEAGVTMGFTRRESTDMAFSLLEGAAHASGEANAHPSLLREQVTSPGGMTIAGTNHLDRTAVRGNIIDAILSARDKGMEMEKSK